MGQRWIDSLPDRQAVHSSPRPQVHPHLCVTDWTRLLLHGAKYAKTLAKDRGVESEPELHGGRQDAEHKHPLPAKRKASWLRRKAEHPSALDSLQPAKTSQWLRPSTNAELQRATVTHAPAAEK